MSKEDPESVAPNNKTPTRWQPDKYWAAQPPNENHSGWSNRPSEVDREQCVLERSKPRKKLEHKRDVEKLEDDPEVARVFDKKLIKGWGSKPVDIVTEFTYMEVVDTGTPLSEAWVSIHTDDLDSVGTNKEILDNIFKEVDDEWSLKETPPDLCWALNEHRYTTQKVHCLTLNTQCRRTCSGRLNNFVSIFQIKL